MCLSLNLPNRKILLIFLILALILLLPFFIVSLTLGYEQSNDYCLSYAGMEDVGIQDITLRQWLRVDGYTRFGFLILAIFFFIASKFIRDKYALVTVESIIFGFYYLFLLGWIIFGAVIFWGNTEKTVIFNEIPVRSNLNTFGINENQLRNHSTLTQIAYRNQQSYSSWHKYDRQKWFHQNFLSNWEKSGNNTNSTWDVYQQKYTTVENRDQALQGFRIGCKSRVRIYMWILLISHLILLPFIILIHCFRSKRTTFAHDTHRYISPKMHGAPVYTSNIPENSNKFHAKGPNYN